MDVFEALADPTRREIVSTCWPPASATPATSPAASTSPACRWSVTSKVLRQSGVISYRHDAQARIYRLEPRSLTEARQWMDAQLDALHARFDRLGEHLDRMKAREEGDAGKGG